MAASDKDFYTPRPYLSYSSYVLFKKNKKEWTNIYLLGNKREFKSAEFGRDFAKAREDDEAVDDRDINFARMMMPKYPIREKEIRVWSGICDVLGRPDGRDDRAHVIADDKTTKITKRSCKKCKSKNTHLSFGTNVCITTCVDCGHVSRDGYGWTQEKTDKHIQFTWYGYIIWKKTGKIYVGHLNWYNFNTKEVRQFITKRTTVDFLQLQADIRLTWEEMQKFCDEFYNQINNK